MPPRRSARSRPAVPSVHLPVPHRAIPPRRAARVAAVVPALPVTPSIPLVRKRTRDGFFPLLTSIEASKNRKRCMFLLDRLRAHKKGEHVLASPLHPDWVGFSPDEVDILKAFYPKRSYYGAPDYRCSRFHASFWWRERVKLQSAITKRRVVYNNCWLH
ncbi:AT hook motif-containing protein [Hordeum vulgare]|nr:AT hook motif-containing protein [Hordeum vulgare]